MINKITKISCFSTKYFTLPWSIYPLANYQKYGLDSEIFSVYELNEKIFTRYDDSIQLCFESINDIEKEEIIQFIKTNQIRMVSGKQELIKLLANAIKNTKAYYGSIFENNKLLSSDNSNIILATSIIDFKKIAKLVCESNSDNKSFYDLDQYFNQIYNRFLQKYCRNWIYKMDDNIIGQIATYAETSKYAVLGGLAVNKDFRKQGIGKKLLFVSNNELIKENKTVYWFCYNDNLNEFYKSVSLKSYPYGKLMIQK